MRRDRPTWPRPRATEDEVERILAATERGIAKLEADPAALTRAGGRRAGCAEANRARRRARPHGTAAVDEPTRRRSTASRSPASATRSAELAEQARAAEAAGIDCVWAVELFRSSITQAMWLAAADRDGRGRHRDRLGVHPQPDDHRALGARHRRGLGWALPARARGRGQAPERDLARSRVRPAGAAPARDGRGGAADHREGGQRRADPLRGRATTRSRSRAGCARIARSARRSRSTRPPSRRGWRGWPATSPTG